MQSEQTKRKQVSEYDIVSMRAQAIGFRIKAESPENALKRLQARNKTHLTPDVPENARVITSTWPDPSEHGEAWLIRGGDLPQDPTGKTVLTWDGQKIARQELPEGFTEALLFGD